MSRYIVMSFVLIIGLGIGSIVPVATSWWYDINHVGIAPKVEFYSLDEVQSFIDTVSESLWLE